MTNDINEDEDIVRELINLVELQCGEVSYGSTDWGLVRQLEGEIDDLVKLIVLKMKGANNA